MYQLCTGISLWHTVILRTGGISLWHTVIPCTGMLVEYAIEFVIYSSPSMTTISPATAHSQKNSYRCASRLDTNMEHGSGDARRRTGYATPLTNRDALSYGPTVYQQIRWTPPPQESCRIIRLVKWRLANQISTTLPGTLSATTH